MRLRDLVHAAGQAFAFGLDQAGSAQLRRQGGPEYPVGVAPTAIDFVVVPGLAFDAHGGRLGYGGGYFDRLLPLMRPDVALAAGAYDEQIVPQVPMAPYDRRMPLVVTPTRAIATGAR